MFASLIGDMVSLFPQSLRSSIDGFEFGSIVGYFLLYFGTVVKAMFCLAIIIAAITRLDDIGEGLTGFIDGLRGGFKELILLPFGWRRVSAIAGLTIKECLRRRVLLVFILFLAPFLFAGWYLPNNEEFMLVSLIAFTTQAMGWLMIPLVVFLTAMSLPTDLQTRVIQTVATKPVRRIELLFGRLIGFMTVFTLMLGLMGLVSYIYIRQMVPPEYREKKFIAKQPIFVSPNPASGWGGRTHVFYRGGKPYERGINVGREYDVRGHVAGGTGDYVILYFAYDKRFFDDLDVVDCELRLDIFKTTKGNASRKDDEKSGVFATVQFISGDDPNGKPLFQKNFRVDNYRETRVQLKKSVLTAYVDKNPELENLGKLFVKISCITPTQYVGLHPLEVYFLAKPTSFEWNFAKSVLTIWFRVLIVTVVAIVASTVLKSYVVVLLAIMVLVIGSYYGFMHDIISSEAKGGGPIESAIRIFTRQNLVTDLEEGFVNDYIVFPIDEFIRNAVMRPVEWVVPNLSALETSQFVAEGVNIPSSRIERNSLLVFGYVIPAFIVGHFLFRTRELAV
jgi:hypothetical protein